ncbi:MAG: DICT sensory domain-containing protein [Anaerolineales bacterium]|nr:hypothetical protein [Anaerolineales bacterium]MDW8446531.1 DICT sensory domain-containing protein [Anaerolineales bacterium]
MQTQDAVSLFTQFFNKALPVFSPQSEAALGELKPEQLRQAQFRYIFSVEAMTSISHLIEDAAAQSLRPAQLHVCFQYLSRVRDQRQRYQEITPRLQGLWLYAVADAELPGWPNTTFIELANSPLVNYWFVVAYGTGLSMTLVAEEKVPSQGSPVAKRVYEGLYTFDEQLAYKLLNLLHLNFPGQVPPPLPPELP